MIKYIFELREIAKWEGMKGGESEWSFGQVLPLLLLLSPLLAISEILTGNSGLKESEPASTSESQTITPVESLTTLNDVINSNSQSTADDTETLHSEPKGDDSEGEEGFDKPSSVLAQNRKDTMEILRDDQRNPSLQGKSNAEWILELENPGGELDKLYQNIYFKAASITTVTLVTVAITVGASYGFVL
ncbi:hypothetical protein TWF730_011265 [Orbilia blumenaviensis]|uniref:Uncharacterized protein n=1 Tax=Orbilia blumenaviensis TaxID=1796055 RepID=A0AAV9UJU8_9PEZI